MNSSEGAEKETPLKKGTQYQKKKEKKKDKYFPLYIFECRG